jgi:phosphoglycerate dehydrogenase-like enzyme
VPEAALLMKSALIKALQEKRIAGAALDVYEVEPPDFQSPLFKLDNCITSRRILAHPPLKPN